MTTVDLSPIRIADLALVLRRLGVELKMHHRDGRFVCSVSQWGEPIGIASTDDLAETLSMALAGPLCGMRSVA